MAANFNSFNHVSRLIIANRIAQALITALCQANPILFLSPRKIKIRPTLFVSFLMLQKKKI
jgi:hypothetical protein